MRLTTRELIERAKERCNKRIIEDFEEMGIDDELIVMMHNSIFKPLTIRKCFFSGDVEVMKKGKVTNRIISVERNPIFESNLAGKIAVKMCEKIRDTNDIDEIEDMFEKTNNISFINIKNGDIIKLTNMEDKNLPKNIYIQFEDLRMHFGFGYKK